MKFVRKETRIWVAIVNVAMTDAFGVVRRRDIAVRIAPNWMRTQEGLYRVDFKVGIFPWEAIDNDVNDGLGFRTKVEAERFAREEIRRRFPAPAQQNHKRTTREAV